jgi:hypothetical protein
MPATLPAELGKEDAAAPPGDTAVAEDATQDPAAATDNAAADTSSGIFGRLKEKVGTAVEKVSEMESVKKGTQLVADKTKAVQQKLSESERVQQGVEFVRKKTTELAENEKVQKGLERAKDAAKVVQEKTQKSVEVVSEKAQQGLEYAKEKTKAVREAAGGVWQKGGGSIEKVKAGVSKLAWRGSARDTLDIAAQEEQWKNIKVQGAEELLVPARKEQTSAYHVAKGSTLRWTFRVKDHDIGFGVRMRVQEWGGAKEEEVLAVERYDSADTVSGSWVADEDRIMILAFDNRYSKLRSKTVAYLVGTEKPPIFSEPKAEAPAAATAAGAAATAAADAPRPIV